MKKILLAVILFSTSLNAETYAVKFGQVRTSDYLMDGTAINVGVIAGFPIKTGTSLEMDLMTTISEGGTSFGWKVSTLAGYYVKRFNQKKHYYKLKAGLIYESIVSDTISSEEHDAGLSLGIGTGWKLSNKNKLEIEYTIIEQDIHYLGLNYYF